MGMRDKEVIDKSDGKIKERMLLLFSHQEIGFDMSHPLPMRCRMTCNSDWAHIDFICNSYNISSLRL